MRYTVEELICRLKSTLPVGYTWDDYMSGKLHLDHIRPISSFSFTSTDNPDFYKCWGLDNLQLLTAHHNLSKNDSYDKAYQLGLAV